MQRILKTALVPLVLALGSVGLTTGAASAASHATPDFSGCGWKPANNSKAAGGFDYDGVYIRSGADTSCSALGEGYVGQSVTVRCEWYNSGDGYEWYYLKDNTTGKIGWSRSDLVGLATPGLLNC